MAKKKDEKPQLDAALVTREENKARLISMIDELETARLRGDISFKDAMALEKDIRIKLNDKFEMEKSEDDRRIIVVPHKHLFICPHTNRECSNMPDKEVCMKYYNLKEK